MLRRTLWKAMAILIVCSVAVPFVQAAPIQQPPSPEKSVSSEPVMVEVFAAVGTDLSAYFVDGDVFARPPFDLGEDKIQVFMGFVDPANLDKIASVAEVQAVIPIRMGRDAAMLPYPANDEQPISQSGPEEWAELYAHADKLREGSLPWSEAKAFGDGRRMIRPLDWFDVRPDGPHMVETAWDRGYQGEGVTVAVLDDGIDFGHADLMGTQKIYSSTLAPQYNGWPMVFSPFSLYVYWAYEQYGVPWFVTQQYEAVHYVDTSITPTLTLSETGVYTFTYLPLNSPTITVPHTYVISDSMSQSDVVHVGTHPDADFRFNLWGEKVAVLVADPNTAGVYDTVYVDLDADYDFRDEKPLTKADVDDLENTKNNMVAYRDLSVPPDGIADISGGMVYFVADGQNVIPASDWMYGATCEAGSEFMCPANGDLVAFSGGTFDGTATGSHGTLCASNVVGQGVTNGLLPSFRDLPGNGKPAGAVYGTAPKAGMVTIGDIYWNHYASSLDGYMFVATGYDGLHQGMISDTDGIQINSNSYGQSNVDNDGWEFRGQFVSQLQRVPAPNTQFLFSTGNGAPGYGTAAPPSPATGIGIGASTQYGSTGWDSITDTNQIMFNDVIAFSNRGPGARGTSAVDVVASGAHAAGAEKLNYHGPTVWGVLDGNTSWDSWGGTSRSAPLSMGVLALIYEAYREANGVWPTHEQAKALFMSSATDLNHETFTQGAGSVNADRGTAVAGGHYGFYVDPPAWTPGDFRGEDYPAFAHLTFPGDTFTKTFALKNTGPQTVTVSVSDAELKLLRAEEFTYTVTSDMVAAERAYGDENQSNFYKAFNYFIPITATAGMSPTMYNDFTIPDETDLMIVRQLFPYDQFDADDDAVWDNRFYLTVYNWKDVNGDGNVWEDRDGNGTVNIINGQVPTDTAIADGDVELKWNDPRTEIDRWEYGRFGYNRPSANGNHLWIHDPLTRMHDGLFIGLYHNPGSTYTDTVTFTYRIEFYQKEDISWLDVDVPASGTLQVPPSVSPGDSTAFVATVSVPADMPPGMYQAAIQVHDPGWTTYSENTTVIPVALNVGTVFTDGLQLGGYDAYAYDEGRPYKNAAVRGMFDWGWREETGDWRFFFFDVPYFETPDGTARFPSGTRLLVKDEWDDAAPHTDIDTVVLGPTPTSLDVPEPDFFGPYVLDTVGQSAAIKAGRSIWRFNSSSGENAEWITAPMTDGLHAFLQHNVLFEGDKFEVVFTKTVGTLQQNPDFFDIDTTQKQGTVGMVSMQASLPLSGLVADAFGLGGPEYMLNEPLDFVNSATWEWTHAFTVTHGARIELWTSSPDISDIDLQLHYCGPTGADCEQRGSSAGGSAAEYILTLMPEDGVWEVRVNNFSGPAGHFDLTKMVIQGYELSLSGVPSGAIAANTEITFTVSYSRTTMEAGETYEGLLLLGPPEAPALIQIPVTINRLEFPIYLPVVSRNYSQ